MTDHPTRAAPENLDTEAAAVAGIGISSPADQNSARQVSLQNPRRDPLIESPFETGRRSSLGPRRGR
ncbi:MAG: hypothetical protein AAF481_17175 [Acidobacteriota bacterium]